MGGGAVDITDAIVSLQALVRTLQHSESSQVFKIYL